MKQLNTIFHFTLTQDNKVVETQYLILTQSHYIETIILNPIFILTQF